MHSINLCRWKLFIHRNKLSIFFQCILIFWYLKLTWLVSLQLAISILVIVFQLSKYILLIFFLLIGFSGWNKHSIGNTEHTIYGFDFRNRIDLISNIPNEYCNHFFRTTLFELHCPSCSLIRFNLRYQLILCLQQQSNYFYSLKLLYTLNSS